MIAHSRRHFLKLAGVVGLGFTGLHRFATQAAAAPSSWDAQPGYGPLQPDPEKLIELPSGFSYKIISRQGSRMSDGFFTPGRADGMATFAGSNGRVILVRNHELNSDDKFSYGAFGKKNELLSKIDRQKVYDFGKGKTPALGGTTTLVYNPQTQTVEQEYLSLAGTLRNCAGGLTPWNSWITCEETTDRQSDTREKDHGYVFEVPALEKLELAEPVALKDMGRFNHEAVAVDPRTSIVYLTEDSGEGLIYRFLPNQSQQLAKGGKLQVLAIKGEKSVDTRNWSNLKTPKFPVNKAVDVEWLDIDRVDAPDDDLRLRGFQKGAARFARGEGMWFGTNEIYFACTNGGDIQQGQIFRYVPSTDEGQTGEKDNPGKLTLFVEPNDTNIVRNCDNLTVAPWGDVVTCEDNDSPRIVGITPQGKFYKIAHNVGSKSEFAGGVFSPDGSTYFVNIQHAGLTLAITGPWRV